MLTVDAKPLVAAIAALRRVVPARSTYPVLTHLRLSAENGTLLLSATNLDTAIDIEIAAEGDLAPVLIEAARLGAIVPALDKPISLEAESAACRLSSGRTVVRLPTMNADAWPELKRIGDGASALTLRGDDLKAVFEMLDGAISNEETRYYLNGIFISNGSVADGAAIGLSAAATNGHTLISRDMPGTAGVTAPIAAIVPGFATREMSRLCAGRAEIVLKIDDGFAELSFAGTRYQTKLIDGHFPDWRRVTPKVEPFATVDPAAIVAAARLVADAAPSKSRAIRLSFGAEDLSLSARGGDAEAEDHVALSRLDDAPHDDIGVSADYLTMIAKVLDVETLEIANADPASPIVLTGAGLSDRKAVIMPMRV